MKAVSTLKSSKALQRALLLVATVVAQSKPDVHLYRKSGDRAWDVESCRSGDGAQSAGSVCLPCAVRGARCALERRESGGGKRGRCRRGLKMRVVWHELKLFLKK